MMTVVVGAAAFRHLALAQAPKPTPAAEEKSSGFKKLVLTPQYYCDGIHTGDFNHDGRPDIVAGPFWYEGPAFTKAHEFYPAVALPPEKEPSNSMFSFVYDFNGDGWDDILVLGRVHLHPAYWYENPKGPGKPWAKHYAFERVQGESPTLVDLDGDGHPQLICHWQGRWGWIEPNWEKPTEPWRFQPISEADEWKEFYHGEGVGDVNGDKRPDLVINDGWFEQPANPKSPWKWHACRFSEGRGGAQMFVYDVDGDGDTDMITAIDAHGWGLAWFEQHKENGQIAFRPHTIMGTRDEISRYGVAFTQPHALDLGDINGDGLPDLVVGKRMWAHGPKGDIEPSEAPVLYWFELKRAKSTQPKNAAASKETDASTTEVQFVPHLIDNHSGVGVQVTIADVNGDGKNDILSASKLGSFLFLNER
jgi:hypothetical protein